MRIRTCALTALLLLPLCVHPSIIRAYLPDGTPLLAGDKDNAPYLAQWLDGGWKPIPVPAGLAPAIGEFESVGADAQGNLYVCYTDEANPKKEVSGLLARIDGSWSRLGAFDKGWSGGSFIGAVSPTEVYLDVRLIKERRDLLLHWNGSAYAVLPLPDGASEIEDLMIDQGSLIVQVDGTSGAGTHRFAQGAWTAMGTPSEESIDLLLHASDGALWRLGRVAERWNGSAWEEPFSFPNSYMEGYHINMAAPGPAGALFLVLVDNDNKDRLACWAGDDLQWFKGRPEASDWKYGIYELVCDRNGTIHVNETERYTMAEFQLARDGYPAQDEKAAEVLALFNAGKLPYKVISMELVRLDSVMEATGAEADKQAYLAKNEELGLWSYSLKQEFIALGLEPGHNRLLDKSIAFHEAMNEYLLWEKKSAMDRAWIQDESNRTAWKQSSLRLQSAFNEMQAEREPYLERNGLE